MCVLSPVSFHGDIIFCVDNGGEPFVPMRPIVDNIGMEWGAQAAKFRANKERWGVSIIDTPSNGGTQPTLCLPLRKLPAWLASINPKKVKPELRAKIELYQNECDDALWDYWINGKAERKPESSAEADALPVLGQMIIRALVRNIASRYQEIDQRSVNMQVWMGLRNYFGIASYKQIPPEKLTEAVIWLANYEYRSRKQERHIGAKENGIDPAMTSDLREILAGIYEMHKQCDRYINHIYAYIGSNVIRMNADIHKQNLFHALVHLKRTSMDGLHMAKDSLLTLWNLGQGVSFI